MILGFSPDKYYTVMQDSMLRDSMLRTGFRDLKYVVADMFPEDSLLIQTEGDLPEEENEEKKDNIIKKIIQAVEGKKSDENEEKKDKKEDKSRETKKKDNQ